MAVDADPLVLTNRAREQQLQHLISTLADGAEPAGDMLEAQERSKKAAMSLADMKGPKLVSVELGAMEELEEYDDPLVASQRAREAHLNGIIETLVDQDDEEEEALGVKEEKDTQAVARQLEAQEPMGDIDPLVASQKARQKQLDSLIHELVEEDKEEEATADMDVLEVATKDEVRARQLQAGDGVVETDPLVEAQRARKSRLNELIDELVEENEQEEKNTAESPALVLAAAEKSQEVDPLVATQTARKERLGELIDQLVDEDEEEAEAVEKGDQLQAEPEVNVNRQLESTTTQQRQAQAFESPLSESQSNPSLRRLEASSTGVESSIQHMWEVSLAGALMVVMGIMLVLIKRRRKHGVESTRRPDVGFAYSSLDE